MESIREKSRRSFPFLHLPLWIFFARPWTSDDAGDASRGDEDDVYEKYKIKMTLGKKK